MFVLAPSSSEVECEAGSITKPVMKIQIWSIMQVVSNVSLISLICSLSKVDHKARKINWRKKKKKERKKTQKANRPTKPCHPLRSQGEVGVTEPYSELKILVPGLAQFK